MYADFTCPHCAVAHARLREPRRVRVAFRHFALKAKHPRAPVLAAAAEAAALQGAFWPFHDALYADQGRQDDPHLWARAERSGLDVERFERRPARRRGRPRASGATCARRCAPGSPRRRRSFAERRRRRLPQRSAILAGFGMTRRTKTGAPTDGRAQRRTTSYESATP